MSKTISLWETACVSVLKYVIFSPENEQKRRVYLIFHFWQEK